MILYNIVFIDFIFIVKILPCFRITGKQAKLIFFPSPASASVEKSREEANWGRNWSASFYLDVKTSSFTRQDEFYAYDIWDLTSGLGGLMGLFIGWSFLSISREHDRAVF